MFCIDLLKCHWQSVDNPSLDSWVDMIMSLLIDLETYTSDEHIPLGHIYVCLRGILCIRRKSEFYTES